MVLCSLEALGQVDVLLEQALELVGDLVEEGVDLLLVVAAQREAEFLVMDIERGELHDPSFLSRPAMTVGHQPPSGGTHMRDAGAARPVCRYTIPRCRAPERRRRRRAASVRIRG
jgi:hypothetical protein